jgi:hypothetical protein
MGNVTTAIVERQVKGSKYETTVDITMSSSYATSGDTIQAADIAKILTPGGFALTDVKQFHAEIGVAGHHAYLDRTNKKITVWNGTTQIANAVDLSAVVFRCTFVYGGVGGVTT